LTQYQSSKGQSATSDDYILLLILCISLFHNNML
jgi:hypothetical protein